MKSSWANAILAVVSSIGALAVADLALRAAEYLPRIDDDYLLGPVGRYRKPDDALILIHPKFLSDEFYRVNPELETVVTLGDSFTEGYPVGETDHLASVLQRILATRGRSVNVINMGLGDSGPDQHLRLLKERLLPKVVPDVVVWTFYSNDLLDNRDQSVYDIENHSLVPTDASEHWLYQRQAVYDRIPLPRAIKGESPVLRVILRAFEALRGPGPREFGQSDDRRSMDKVRLAIEEIERLAKVHGIRVVYALIAPQALYLATSNARDVFEVEQYVQLRSILSDRGSFADASFTGSTASACGSNYDLPEDIAPVWSTLFVNDGRDANPLGHRHFNEKAYRILAGMVATCLTNSER